MSHENENPNAITVDVGGAELRVTPHTELEYPESLAAAVIASRIVTKTKRAGDDGATGIDEDLYQLLELCVEDGIQRSTLETLGPHELAAVLEAAVPEADTERDDDQ